MMASLRARACALLSAVLALSQASRAAAQYNCAGVNAAMADNDGTSPLGAGVGIVSIVGSVLNDLRDCETAPGYYLRRQSATEIGRVHV